MSAPSDQTPGDSPAFSDLALGDAVLKALQDVGYESPSPIQAATIPHLLSGSDVVGQAQTGTGKTAAFALPILSKIDVSEAVPQALVLVPTRELAIQVAEAFQRYATYLKGFHVLPVYGGQSYTPQLQSLRRGVHVVVATPGRAMDHMKRGTLDLSSLRHLVLDEADEMLRMGFIDDVEWILEQAPKERQIALFSATMPAQVRRIAQHHLREPAEVTIRSKTTTASKIRQRYWIVSGMHKLDALTRILEAEPFDAMIVFARTKIATEELAERLSARGFAVEALNGDIVQVQRERTIARLKSGQIDIVVATDVAARGLDVERVSHVVNYDVPYDPESYVHRIGRTGRAGRSGEAILFIAPRERNMLRVIERTTRQTIESMQLPSVEDVNERRVAKFNEKLTAAIASNAGQAFLPLIENYERDNNVSATEIAAALASIAQGATPLLLEPGREREPARETAPYERPGKAGRKERPSRDSAWGDEASSYARRADRTGRGERSRGSVSGADASPYARRVERTGRDEGSRGSASGEDASPYERRAGRDSREERSRDFESSREASPYERRRDRAGRDDKSARVQQTSPERESGAFDQEVAAETPDRARHYDKPARVKQTSSEREVDTFDQDAAAESLDRPRRDDKSAHVKQTSSEREVDTLDPDAAAETLDRARRYDKPARVKQTFSEREVDTFDQDAAAETLDRPSKGFDVDATSTLGAEAAPRPLNRRERRALERAQREGTALDGQREIESDAAPVEESRGEAPQPRVAKRPFPRDEERRSDAGRSRDFSDDKRGRGRGDEDVETYRIEVGHLHGVKPNNIVGAIANEVGLEGKRIGRVVIRDDHSFVDLPAGMPKDVFRQLQKVRVGGQQLQISRALKTHVEKLRRERPTTPKFISKNKSAPKRRR